jgi:hypothetical protein
VASGLEEEAAEFPGPDVNERGQGPENIQPEIQWTTGGRAAYRLS